MGVARLRLLPPPSCTILLDVTLPAVLLTMLPLLMVMLLLVSMLLPPLLLVASIQG